MAQVVRVEEKKICWEPTAIIQKRNRGGWDQGGGSGESGKQLQCLKGGSS